MSILFSLFPFSAWRLEICGPMLNVVVPQLYNQAGIAETWTCHLSKPYKGYNWVRQLLDCKRNNERHGEMLRSHLSVKMLTMFQSKMLEWFYTEISPGLMLVRDPRIIWLSDDAITCVYRPTREFLVYKFQRSLRPFSAFHLAKRLPGEGL